MNPTPPSLPGLLSLYWRDFTIRYAMNTAVMALLVALGIPWASQPVSPAQPPVGMSLEAALVEKIAIGGFVFAALAAIILLRRYLWVRKVLSRGTVVNGTVEEIDVYSRRTDDNTHTTRKPTYRYSYFVIVSYFSYGMHRKVRLKLPNSGFVYNMTKGGETDLIVLDSAPDKPLLRAVYLGRF